MRWFAVTALSCVAFIAAVATACEATPRLRGRVVDVRGPATAIVAHAAMPGMPAMSMPFLVAPRTLQKLQRGMEITAGVDPRTSPATLTAIAIERVPVPVAHYVPELERGDTVPDFAFVDQRGNARSLVRFRGQALVLSFIYTRCRDATMCSLVSAKYARLQRLLGRERIHLMEATLDPSYDTPAILARYGAAFGADATRWTLATGKSAAIADLAARAGIVTTETPRGIIHSEAVLIVDPSGRLTQLIDGNRWSPEEVLSEARASIGEVPSPLARLRLWLDTGVAAVCGGRSGMTTAMALTIFVAVLILATLVLRRLLRAHTTRT